MAAYTYVGYPAVLSMIAGAGPRREEDAATSTEDLPTLTVIVAALSEQDVIARKIDDTLAQEYRAGALDVVVVTDGSIDATGDVAIGKGVMVLHDPRRLGKSAAVNRGVAAATGDIVCLSDANCTLQPAPCARWWRRSPTRA